MSKKPLYIVTTPKIGESEPKYAHGKNPRSLANLRPSWKKGESGNPEGKQAVGPVITPALRRFANLPVSQFYRLPVYDLTVAEAIAAGYLTLAMQREGDRARDEVTDRLDGSVIQAIVIEQEPKAIVELRKLREAIEAHGDGG